MTRIHRAITSLEIEPGSLGIFWLGQAGFVFKTSTGQLVYIDAYLSNMCERAPEWVLSKRLIPAPIEPTEITTGLVAATHAHDDHIDLETIALLAKTAPEVHYAGPVSCLKMIEPLGVAANQKHLLSLGSPCTFEGFSLRAVYADHGELEPDAVGIVLEADGIKVYHTGDTCYCPERMEEVISLKPDIIIACINGTYGNLSASEAARLAGTVGAKVAIPCHFWFFVGQNTRGDCTPKAFLDACKELAPTTTPRILTVGEPYVYQRR